MAASERFVNKIEACAARCLDIIEAGNVRGRLTKSELAELDRAEFSELPIWERAYQLAVEHETKRTPRRSVLVQHYGIYRFGRGLGNPVLSFVATDSDALLEFARFGNTTDNPPEYWALDNVEIRGVVPEPTSLALFASAIACCFAFRVRGR
jgi:hypothetical protein